MGLLKPNVEKLEAKGDLAGLARAARHSDNQIRYAAFHALERLGERSTETLAELLAGGGSTEDEQYCAAASLGKIGSARAAMALLDALDTLVPRRGWTSRTVYTDDVVLDRLLDSLGEIGAPAVEPIVGVLPHHPLKRRLATQLGHTGDARAVAPLTGALREGGEDPRLEQAVCEALALLGQREAGVIAMDAAGTADVLVRVLRSAIENGDGETASFAAEALRILRPEPAAAAGPAAPAAAEEEIVEIARRAVPQTEEPVHFFVPSSNASLIEAFHGLFRMGAPAYGGSAGRYHADVRRLDARRSEAAAAALPFSGRRLMLADETGETGVADVLGELGAQSGTGGIWIAYISVGPDGSSWVRQVYDQLAREAIGQGLLPFPMYSTRNGEAAGFLLDSLEPAAP